MSRILIVDDEPGIRQSLKGAFEDEGFATETAASGEECLQKLDVTPCELVLLDIWPRDHRHRGHCDQTRSIRLHRETALPGAHVAGRQKRALAPAVGKSS